MPSEKWYNYFSSVLNSSPSKSQPSAEVCRGATFVDTEMNRETLKQRITEDN